MPVYDYKGLNAGGDAKTGIIDADSPREARLKLRSQNVLVTEITRARADACAAEVGKKKVLEFRRRAKGKDEVPMYTRQLATLLQGRHPPRPGDVGPDRAVLRSRTSRPRSATCARS